jgi:glycosyltransferase involved in cell wall biosynthesis
MKRTRRPPRVLYLAFYFPPSRASGVYRARATANFLVDKGWDVTTIAAPMRFLRDVIGSLDEQLEETVDPRVVVERPDFNQFVWARDIRKFGRFRRNYPTVASKLHRWNLEHIFPEHYSAWGMASVRRALRLHSRKRFDLVVATGNPFSSFAAAWMFHRLTGVPYVVDYRDSWTLNLFEDGPAFDDDHIAWDWERRIVKGAQTVVFVNSALREWHAERYPKQADRMMVVPNGWDPDLMITSSSNTAPAPPDPDRPLTFTYLGTISSMQPVEEMINAFERARDHPDLSNAELNIYGYLGFFRGSHDEIIERFGLDIASPEAQSTLPVDRGIRYRGPVSKTDVADVYEQSDVLVFMAGGARYVTSGKIFEYMATGKPIVSVHAPGIAATEVLSGYPLWFTADSLDPDAIAQTMIAAGKASRGLTEEQRAAGRAHADAYTRQAVLTPFEARLREIVGRTNDAEGQ